MQWRLGWRGMFSQRGGGQRIYIYIYTRRQIDKIYGNPCAFNKNHLSCKVRIIGYIWVTLNPVKSETPSLDMILIKSSLHGQGLVCVAHFFSLKINKCIFVYIISMQIMLSMESCLKLCVHSFLQIQSTLEDKRNSTENRFKFFKYEFPKNIEYILKVLK